MNKQLVIICLIGAFSFLNATAQNRVVVEMGNTTHAGDHTPLWQNSLQHGLSSTDNNAYMRAGVFYADTLAHTWRYSAGIDLAAGYGMDAPFFVQQAYADVSWRCFDLSVGSKEIGSKFFNNDLTTGDLIWSGNARPIPQIRAGIFDYIPVLHSSWAYIRGEIAYGWWTDGKYLADAAGSERWYTRDIKYHHKEFDMLFGKPTGRLSFEISYRLDNQFGGYMEQHPKQNIFPNGFDLGNNLESYWKALIPQPSDRTEEGMAGERIAREGNFLGSETFKLSYRFPKHTLSAYMQNFYDDFSGMGKLNGFDGLYGIEYNNNNSHSWLRAVVLEYYQTTNQSGPLHGSDNPDGEKTGGADDYYNNALYQGWTHWGQGMANPLIASPAYFADEIVYSNWARGGYHPGTGGVRYKGYMGFPYNRVRSFHLGVQGDIAQTWKYRLKLTTSRTYGTPFVPTLRPLDSYSGFLEVSHTPRWANNMFILASLAFDKGDIYGDNAGVQLKLRKTFNL